MKKGTYRDVLKIPVRVISGNCGTAIDVREGRGRGKVKGEYGGIGVEERGS